MGCKNFMFKPFTKERRNSSEFSDIFALVINTFFMFDHCWKSCESFINICYLHDFFPFSFHVFLALDGVMAEVMVCIDLRIAVVIHGFLSACGNPRF